MILVRLIVKIIPGLAVLLLGWAGYRIYSTGSCLVKFRGPASLTLYLGDAKKTLVDFLGPLAGWLREL